MTSRITNLKSKYPFYCYGNSLLKKKMLAAIDHYTFSLGEGNLILCCTGSADPNFRQIKIIIILKSLKILKKILKLARKVSKVMIFWKCWISGFFWFRTLKFDAFKAYNKVFIDHTFIFSLSICVRVLSFNVFIWFPSQISLFLIPS